MEKTLKQVQNDIVLFVKLETLKQVQNDIVLFVKLETLKHRVGTEYYVSHLLQLIF